jgi:uncharacterized protein (TIGR03083 family)
VSTAAELDYLDHLARESARFGEVLLAAPGGDRVPTCPDWDAVDLLWHLAQVQWFWASVVRLRLLEDADVEALEAQRPGDGAGIHAFFERASRDLLAALTAASPDDPAWTWSTDHTVGFIRRRQAHEALIHRLDAELTVGLRTPMDPRLCADGVDEALRVMYGGQPSWGTFAPAEAQTVRVVATDTGDSWLVTLGRFTGVDPDSGAVDEPDLRVATTDWGGDAAATLTGTAVDLDCWLWHRPTVGRLERAGDAAVLETLESITAAGIN